MKIGVLEHPRIASEKRFNDIANTPLWSCLMGGYAASALERAGFETTFLDTAVPGASFERALEDIVALDPDLLCINAVYFWEHTPALFEFIDALKAGNAFIHINLFGFFPSLVYRQILQASASVTSIAVGEFEQTLVDLATALQAGQDLETIHGLALASCLETEESRLRTPSGNPDDFAFPKRASLEGCITILASRGCYNHCSFCPVPSFYNQGPLWRGRSPENIVQEMVALADQGVNDFYFVDPNFIGPGKSGRKRLFKLMELIRPLKITFGMETRPGDLDDDVLDSLVSSGLTSLLMGVESGSGRVLGSMNKSSGPETAGKAIALCRKYAIEPEIGFLMFVPDSHIDDLRQNMDFLVKNSLLDRLDRTANLLCHCQIVLAGTSGYRCFEGQNRLQKHGIFNFEGEVIFRDPAVKQISELVVFACHTALRMMGDPLSPLFWKNPSAKASGKVNDFLVDFFFSLLDSTERQTLPTDRKAARSMIVKSMNQLI